MLEEFVDVNSFCIFFHHYSYCWTEDVIYRDNIRSLGFKGEKEFLEFRCVSIFPWLINSRSFYLLLVLGFYSLPIVLTFNCKKLHHQNERHSSTSFFIFHWREKSVCLIYFLLSYCKVIKNQLCVKLQCQRTQCFLLSVLLKNTILSSIWFFAFLQWGDKAPASK